MKNNGVHRFPSTNSGSQEVNYNARDSNNCILKSANTASRQTDKDLCHPDKAIQLKQNFLSSIKTGPASTNEKKESTGNNLFNFLDSCNNSSNPKPGSKWQTTSGGDQLNSKCQENASSENLLGLQRFQSGRAAKRYASVD